MQTRVKPAYYLVLVVYALLIGGLLYREFGGTRAQKYSLGEISIAANQSAGVAGTIFPGKSAVFRSLRLKYRSFSLEIPDSNTAVEVYDDGTEMPVAVSQIDRSSSNIRIQLVSGIELTVSETPETDGYLITASFDKVTDRGLVGLRLPWSGGDAEIHPALPILRASPPGTSGGLVLLPRSARVNENFLSLARSGDHQEILLLNPKDEDSLVSTWFTFRKDLATRQEAEKALREFYDRAYTGWDTERWLPDAGSWEYAADAPEEGVTAAAMLQESLQRGTYFSVRERLAGASPRLIDATSTLYLGSMVPPLRNFGTEIASYVRELKGKVQAEDGTVFDSLDRLSLVFDAGLPETAGLRDNLAALAEKLILAKFESRDDLVRALNAAEFLLRYVDANHSGIRYLIREQLLPRVCVTRFGYGILFGDTVDTAVNVMAGRLLTASGDEFSASVGYTLLVSMVRSAGDYARTPAQITRKEFGDDPGTRVLEPETLTRLLPLSGTAAYTPKAVKLDSGAGWMWTTADDIRYRAGQTSVLSFEFPRGGIHHFALYNVEPFDEIQMHGIPWKSDPEFQRYNDGWVYDARRKALFVKIRQRANREEIRIVRRPAAAEQPAAAN